MSIVVTHFAVASISYTFPLHWTIPFSQCLECKAGSGTPFYLMMQETEVNKLSLNNVPFFIVYSPFWYRTGLEPIPVILVNTSHEVSVGPICSHLY